MINQGILVYPISLGFDDVIKRIENLYNDGYYAEAFVTTFFTLEKTINRVLRQIVVSAGFISGDADKIVKNIKLHSVSKQWCFYDPYRRSLRQILGKDVVTKINSLSMFRNELVHGKRVYNEDKLEVYFNDTISILKEMRNTFLIEYGYDGWSKFKARRKAKLHFDPKIKIN